MEERLTLFGMLKGNLLTDGEKAAVEEILKAHLPDAERKDFEDVVSGRKLPQLTSDVIAKRVFSPALHPDRLGWLLRKVTKDGSIAVAGPAGEELPVRSAVGKKIITDIPSAGPDGRSFDVEMQVRAQDFILQRAEIYSSDMLVIQYSAGEGQKKGEVGYGNVAGVVLAVLMRHSPEAFRKFDSRNSAGGARSEAKRYIHRFGERKADSGLRYTPLARTVFVQLDECLDQFGKGTDGEGDAELQKFLAMVADVNSRKVRENLDGIPFGGEIIAELEEMAQTKEVQAMLLEEKYAAADWNSYMSQARKEGLSQGLSQGRMEGRSEGRSEGRIEERENNIETAARNIMKRNPGMSYEDAREDAEALLS